MLPFLFGSGPEPGRGPGLSERVAETLDAVGMFNRSAERPAGLSGGERQRVAVARALVLAPQVLLCDEPTGNLDPHTGFEIVDLLCRVHESSKATVLVVTHDEALSKEARRVLELRRGVLDDWGGPAGAEP